MNNRRTPRMTPRQTEVRNFVREWIFLKGKNPRVQEIADGLEITRTAVRKHVDRIVAKGYLCRLNRRYRNIALPGAPRGYGGREFA